MLLPAVARPESVAAQRLAVAGIIDPRIPLALEELSAVQGPLFERVRERMEEFLRSAQDPGPFSRDLYEPGHFTASGFVLDPDRTRLLLILHRRLGLWLQPGGHVEPTDVSLLAAAEREVCEETGILPPSVLESCFDLDIHRIPATSSAPSHLHFDVRALLGAQDLLLRQAHEVADARWFELEVLAHGESELSPGFGTDESVRRAAARLMERYK